MRVHLRTYVMLLICVGFLQAATAQTTIIDPAGAGGFEIGADFAANGWTVANGSAVNKWFVGNVPSGFSNRAAYISNDAAGATWNYALTSASVVHFYRDVTFPAGETDITLSFNWAAQGETGSWDILMVSLAPTSYTPTGSTTSLGTSTLPAPVITLAQLWTSSTAQTATIKISKAVAGNCAAATTMRLIFTWKNDGGGGTQPPAAVDDISLISQGTPGGSRIPASGGTFTIDPGQPNTGTNFSTFTEAVTALNSARCDAFTNAVTFNVAANQNFVETVPPITASGSAGALITFQRSGTGANPVVTRNDPGTIATSTIGGQGDGILILDGADYITFNAIDVQAFDQGIEYGYFLRRAAGVDGCKNVTIKNAAISMARGTSTYVSGIYSSALDAGSPVNSATGITITSTGGRNENVTITGNTISNVFYAIQLRGFGAASPYDLFDQNFVIGAAGAGNGNTINNFGGTSTTAVYGIYINNHNNAVVNYNTINNTDNGGVASTGTIYGIYMATGTNSVFTANYNIITLASAYASGSVYGIYNSAATGNLTVNNNQVALNNGASSSGTFAFIYNGSATAATLVNFNNNQFSTTGITSTGSVYLIYNSVTNAALTNIQNNSTSGSIMVTGTASFYCYNNSSSPTGIDNFSGNSFTDINVGSTFYGYYTSTTTTHRRNAFNNTILNITSAGGTMYGIYKGAGSSNIYNNKIAGFTANSTTSATVNGIYILSGVKDSIYNNIVGDLNAPSASSVNAVSGIYIGSTSTSSTVGVYYNTVYLSATSGGANFGSSAFYAAGSATATSAALELKNNIFVNNSQPNGTGYTAVYRRSNTNFANYATTSNNNLLYTASAGGNTVYFYDGTNADASLAEFKARFSPRETNTVSENPPFVSIIPTDATYLHISPGTPTQIESGGTPVGGITTDFDGNARNGSSPDIGADEFAGMAVDLSGPTITYTALTAACNTADRALTGVSITDASGVPVSGSLVPRVYYRKGTGTWYSQPGTLASGTSTNGTWNFNIVVADLGGVALGDVISYYVIAQDVSPAANVSSNPFGVTASNVNTVTTHPANPNTFVVGMSLTGNYNIGASSSFKNLSNAVSVYNGCPVAGAVSFTLTDPSYTESFPIVIKANAAASATNTLLIRPATGVAVNLSGAPAGVDASSMIKLQGAKYVTVNGINTGGTSFTIENTATITGSAVVWLSSDGVALGSTNNTVKNLVLKGGVQQTLSVTTATFGVVVAGNALGAITSVAAGNDNDNNLIDSNTITTVRYGIFTRGGSATNLNTGNVISNNTIGAASFDADRIGKAGIIVREEDGIVITKNHIRNLGGNYTDVTSGTARGGIFLSNDAVWTPTTVVVKNAAVTRNNIHDIVDERTYSVVGIAVGAADGTNVTNNLVANNMISNLLANGTAGDQVVGIGINAGKGDKIVYNSIALAGDTDPTAGSTTPTTSSFGISISSTSVSDVSIVNNIVSMDLLSSSGPALKHAAINIPASYTWGTGVLNFNDYYILSSNAQSNIGAIGGNGGTFYNTLAGWKTASGKDANSKDVDPLFVSATDLHLQSSSPLDLQATPLPYVTTDFDGQQRDATLPDIGADEINVTSCTGAVGGTITAAQTTRCAGDSTIISASGFSTGTGSGYQWQSSTDNINWNDMAGATSPASLNTHGLSATTYYKLKVTCASGTAVNYSNTVTITVNPLPTLAISPTGNIDLCSPATQLLSLTNTSASNPTYQWQLNGANISGSTASNYTATATGVYSLKVTDGTTGCSNNSASANVTINPQPSAVTVSPATVTMCGNTDAAQMLTASGGTIAKTMESGTQANQNSASVGSAGYPAPFSNYYGGNRHQFLVRASELTAAGFASGSPLTAINFPVVSLGSTFTNNLDFKVKIGHTTQTTLTAFVAGLTNVFGPATVTPTAGYNNQLNFTAPFVWNGTDNIIIETTYSNNNSGTSDDVVVMYNSPTAFASTVVYRGDSYSAATVESTTSVSYSYNARPDFKLVSNVPTSMTWTPATGLYTDAAATVPYVAGTNTKTVYAKPTTNVTYTATGTSAAGCSNTGTVSITQNCAVPITLLQFKGERSGSINKLDWTTATEINNAGFELQRSADGVNFSSLAFVGSKASNGNSVNAITYNFDDVRPLAGSGYYRLKQVDKDGKATMSKVVLIKGAKVNAVTFTSIYPNPVHDKLNTIITSPVTEVVQLVITDLSGKVISKQAASLVSGDNKIEMPVSSLASGTYFIKATCANGCETAVHKFVKQ
jgi:trimeric autotransporter adhesin